MAKITFVFTGIGMGHLKGDVWKIIFPFDAGGCHKVLFDDATDKPIPLNAPKTKVYVVVNSNPLPPAGTGTDFDKIFDLTGDQVHSDISLKSNWDESGVLLEIPNAVMSMNEPSQSLYNLEKGGMHIKDLHIIAFSAKAEIELSKGGSVEVNVKGKETFSRLYEEADGDKTIILNNNCDGNPVSSEGDLQLLYDLIIDGIPPSAQFTIKRNLIEAPPSSILEKTLSIKTIGHNQDAQDHNPLFSDPPDILPCYFTVASKINNF